MIRLLPVLLGLCQCGLAQADFKAGLEAYRRGDFKTAEAEWRRVSEHSPVTPDFRWQSRGARHRADACYALGILYHEGQGVARDVKEAARWFKEAATEGHPGAQLKLGYLFMTGSGVSQDYREGLRWFEAAAEQGDTDAQFNLATIYDKGVKGVLADPKEALRWYRRAAAQGDSEAARIVAQRETSPIAAARDSLPHENEGALWLAAADPGHYTLQLLAANDRSRVEAWAVRHAVGKPWGIFHFTRDGTDWYALLHGVFATRRDAERASRAWGGEKARSRPWIRRVDEVVRVMGLGR